MAIVAIDTIVDPGCRYGCLKKRLDLRISASDDIYDGMQTLHNIRVNINASRVWYKLNEKLKYL